MAGLALGTQARTMHVGDAHWRSMTFNVLTLAELAHVMAIRSEHESFFRQGITSNRPLLGPVVLTVGLQLATLYVPAFTRAFKMTPLTLGALLACIGATSLVFVAVEVETWMIRRRWIYHESTAAVVHGA